MEKHLVGVPFLCGYEDSDVRMDCSSECNRVAAQVRFASFLWVAYAVSDTERRILVYVILCTKGSAVVVAALRHSS